MQVPVISWHAMTKKYLDSVRRTLSRRRGSLERSRMALVEFIAAQLDLAEGKFDAAEARLLEAGRLTKSERSARTHIEINLPLFGLYREIGDSKRAVELARDWLKRMGIWEGMDTSQDFSVYAWRTLLHEGAMTRAEFAKKRTEWLMAPRQIEPNKQLGAWVRAYVSGINNKEEADEALAAMTSVPQAPLEQYVRVEPGEIAKVYFLAGIYDKALSGLRLATNRCGEFRNPTWFIQLRLALGQTLEKTGDKIGACESYRYVLDRWGHAQPRSVTAEKAEALAKALNCPVEG